MNFQKGDRIVHGGYGPCRVTFVGSEYIGICTTHGQHILVKNKSGEMQPWSQEGEAEWQASVAVEDIKDNIDKKRPWPESTFVFEPEDVQHYLGSHWEPFEEHRVSTIVQQLPDILEAAFVVEGFGGNTDRPRELPQEWETGCHLIWPAQDKGVILTLTVNKAEGRLEFSSMFPFHAGDRSHRLILDKVSVWDNGVEAQIHTEFGDAGIDFYDAHYLLNRGWYEHGKEYAFVLIGIAYSAVPAELTEIPFTPNPDQIAWEAMLARESGEELRETPSTINLKGAAFFLAISEWDVDDYSFRGSITAIRPCTGFLGQDGWLVTVTVLRLKEDFDLDIVLTCRAWKGETPPEVGMDIEGQLWLQGYLNDIV